MRKLAHGQHLLRERLLQSKYQIELKITGNQGLDPLTKSALFDTIWIHIGDEKWTRKQAIFLINKQKK